MTCCVDAFKIAEGIVENMLRIPFMPRMVVEFVETICEINHGR